MSLAKEPRSGGEAHSVKHGADKRSFPPRGPLWGLVKLLGVLFLDRGRCANHQWRQRRWPMSDDGNVARVR